MVSQSKTNWEVSDQSITVAGERVGCVLVSTNDKQVAVNTQSMLEMLQRSEVSNPPAFGAKIASQVLGNDELRQMWFQDMMIMSGRIRSMRAALYEKLISFGKSSRNCLRSIIHICRGAWVLGPFDPAVWDVWISGSVA